jgi:hypothetical protein
MTKELSVKGAIPEIKIAEEVAIQEVKVFIEYHLDEPIEADQVAKDYRETVKAVMRGNLNLTDADTPVLKLSKPLTKEDGSVYLESIPFLTRCTPNKLAQLAKGMDIQKDALAFANKMTSYYIQQPSSSILDLIGKHDYKVIQQIVGLFQ